MKLTKKEILRLRESITPSDKTEIERIIRKEIKDFTEETKFKNKIKDMISDDHKSRDFERKMVELSKNVLVQLFKQMYNKRSFWASGLSNDAS